MATKIPDSSSQAAPQGENAVASTPPRSGPGPPEHQISTSRSQVFKSGSLFVSSKGIGWTSWKKRWFVLTRTSLVFFRNDPNAPNQKVGDMNLTLGGIDLNNSASVEVKADKKLLTVFFPDGGDGRAFTLKAETTEDLFEWKIALESALALAPTPTLSPGKATPLDQSEEANGSTDQQNDKPPGKSMVIGRPVLLALEDIDGTPSFLEKALRFIEDHGLRVEGILRQAADVDEVHYRVREYEQGKTEFTPGEDAHVIGDCIKYILRELPSSPVPASCCKALVDAYRSERDNRLNAVRNAILETFPEPNRKLLQRCLIMMLKIAAHKNENLMSISAVAACMSPLLLRPLLAGECQLEDSHMDVAGDGSFQLLQAAAAANHAQAIIIMLLEEYKSIFGEGEGAPDYFSDSEEGESNSDSDDMYEEDDDYEDGSDYEGETDDDYEHSGSETCSSSGEHQDSDSGDDDKHSSSSHSSSSSSSKSSESDDKHRAKKRSPSASPHTPAQGADNNTKQKKDEDSSKSHGNIPAGTTSGHEKVKFDDKSTQILGSSSQARIWGRTPARKNVSMESIDFHVDDEDEIGRLEVEKAGLQTQIEKEANGNAKLLASLEDRKKSLHERRLDLQKDVGRLRDQLQKERELREALEAGHSVSHLPAAAGIDEKTKAKIEEIALAQREHDNLKQRADDLELELNHEREQNAALMQGRSVTTQGTSSQKTMLQSNRESISRHCERSSKNENHHIDDHNDGKIDSSRSSSSKFGWFQNNSSPKENSIPRATSTRKPAKDEGTLSKLTTRLNFLKERRTQIASELENLPSSSSSQTSGNAKAPEPLQVDPRNAQGFEGSSEECTTHPNKEGGHRRSNSVKPSTPSPKDLDPSGKKHGTHSNTQHPNRLNSEGAEKGSR